MTTCVLLSGSNGFIGKRLSRSFEQLGWKVQKTGDILKPIRFRTKPDIIVHLAAVSNAAEFSKNPDKAVHTNVTGTYNLLSIAKTCKSHFIFFSTSAVYGPSEKVRVSEDQEMKPTSQYAKSKMMGEILCENFFNRYKFPVSILRLFNIYGPGQKNQFLIPYVINQGSKNKLLKIRHPSYERDFLHVDDLVDAVIRLAKRKRKGFHRFNIGSGQLVSVKVLIGKIGKAMRQPIRWKKTKDKQNGEIPKISANNRALQKFAGWKKKISFQEGLKGLIHEYR